MPATSVPANRVELSPPTRSGRDFGSKLFLAERLFKKEEQQVKERASNQARNNERKEEKYQKTTKVIYLAERKAQFPLFGNMTPFVS